MRICRTSYSETADRRLDIEVVMGDVVREGSSAEDMENEDVPNVPKILEEESDTLLPDILIEECEIYSMKDTKDKSESKGSLDSAFNECYIKKEEMDSGNTLQADLNKSRESFDSAYTDSITSNDSRTALLKIQIEDSDTQTCLTKVDYVQKEFIPASAKSSFWDITDFGHEIEMRANRPRTNTVTRLTESAAYIDQMSCPSPGVERLKSACRNAVLNLSQEMVFKSMSVLELDKQGLKHPETDVEIEVEEIGFINNHMRNLIVLSVGISLTNTAIGSLRNLQSSLNHDGGIGLYSLAAGFLSFTIFSLLTPFIVQKFRPKRCLIFSLLTQLVYIVLNLQPTFAVFIPASFIQGIGNALLWNAMSTYTTYLARASALKKNERTVDVASKFFGIFFFFFQFSVVLGNLISSMVLLLGQNGVTTEQNTTSVIGQPLPHVFVSNRSHLNMTYNMTSSTSSPNTPLQHYEFCGSKYCHSYKIQNSGMQVDEETKYLLISIYGMCVVFAIVGCSYLLDPVKTYVASSSSCSLISSQIVSVLKCMFDWRFMLVSGILMYSNMQLAFVTAEVTKAFITCPVGIFMVGYCMIVYGVCGGTTSFIGGRLNKHIGRIPLIATAALTNLGLLALMVFWRPAPDQLYAFCLLLGAWGLGDGIWISQVNCVLSALFPDKLEEAFAASRTLQGLGAAIVVSYASHLCMMSKITIMAVVCIVVTCMYITVELVAAPGKDENEKEPISKA